jgi:voltage-gated potassium channel
MQQPFTKDKDHWRARLYKVVFESDTPAGKLFDVLLLILIVISLIVVMLQSIPRINVVYGQELYITEWIITILFTVEYILRCLAVKGPLNYSKSFYGIVDIISILPTYLSLLFPTSHYLLVIRGLRLMRVFRIFKLTHFVRESMGIVLAMKASARRIAVFLAFVFLLTIIMGSIVYVVENPYNSQFSSIPESIYWCIVTITTVGYGDISPVTSAGKIVASVIMLLGYAIIAVPTGIVTVELSKMSGQHTSRKICSHCASTNHDSEAIFCKYCGYALEERVIEPSNKPKS